MSTKELSNKTMYAVKIHILISVLTDSFHKNTNEKRPYMQWGKQDVYFPFYVINQIAIAFSDIHDEDNLINRSP